MDRSSVIWLISETYAKNEYGVMEATQTRRKVFANCTSVSMEEWSNGGRLGLNPEFRFQMLEFEYHGEEILEYKGKMYAIYRTYHGRNGIIDLYTQRRQGDAENGE